jgi:hypothetical protein
MGTGSSRVHVTNLEHTPEDGFVEYAEQGGPTNGYDDFDALAQTIPESKKYIERRTIVNNREVYVFGHPRIDINVLSKLESYKVNNLRNIDVNTYMTLVSVPFFDDGTYTIDKINRELETIHSFLSSFTHVRKHVIGRENNEKVFPMRDCKNIGKLMYDIGSVLAQNHAADIIAKHCSADMKKYANIMKFKSVYVSEDRTDPTSLKYQLHAVRVPPPAGFINLSAFLSTAPANDPEPQYNVLLAGFKMCRTLEALIPHGLNLHSPPTFGLTAKNKRDNYRGVLIEMMDMDIIYDNVYWCPVQELTQEDIRIAQKAQEEQDQRHEQFVRRIAEQNAISEAMAQRSQTLEKIQEKNEETDKANEIDRLAKQKQAEEEKFRNHIKTQQEKAGIYVNRSNPPTATPAVLEAAAAAAAARAPESNFGQRNGDERVWRITVAAASAILASHPSFDLIRNLNIRLSNGTISPVSVVEFIDRYKKTLEPLYTTTGETAASIIQKRVLPPVRINITEIVLLRYIVMLYLRMSAYPAYMVDITSFGRKKSTKRTRVR